MRSTVRRRHPHRGRIFRVTIGEKTHIVRARSRRHASQKARGKHDSESARP